MQDRAYLQRLAEILVACFDSTNNVLKTSATVGSVTVDTEFPAAAAAADAFANPTTTNVLSMIMGWNGTTWDRLKSDTTNGLDVDVTRLPALVAGTALIGKVGLDQTTPGTTNAVAIDQTTPGTTNKVVASVASGGIASGAIASGAVASGAFASGALASGSVASGAIASGAVASGAFASGSIAAGAVAAGASSFVKLEDVASADADAGVPAMAIRKATPANTSGTDGDYEMLQMSAGKLWTDAQVHGTVADDGVSADNPVIAGAVAVDMDGTAPGQVSAEGDAAQLRAGVDRILLVNQSHPRYVGSNTNYSSAQTNTSLISAPGANLSIWVTDLVISADTAGNVKIVESTGASPATVMGPYYLAANGGVSIQLRNPVKLTANKDLGVTSVNSGNHTVTVKGYIAP